LKRKPSDPQLRLSLFRLKEQRVPVTLQHGEAKSLIRLEGTVEIASAAGLKKVLVEALGSTRELHLSLQSTTALDVTAVQLLWAAELEAKASGIGFALEGEAPEQVLSTLVSAGFGSFPSLRMPGKPSGVCRCQP
jgi:hypothetical protein